MGYVHIKTDTDIPIPAYATKGSAGFDIRASENKIVPILGRKAIKTGLYLALQSDLELQIRSRSGLALKNGIFVLNSPGTLDSDYRGELMIILANFGESPFVVKRGDRIAQGIVSHFERVEFIVVAELPESERGTSGLGSTGTK